MRDDGLILKRLSPKMREALLGAPPLSFFWAVEYWDGVAISQFHPDTGAELKWADVLAANKRVKRVLWLPFGVDFAAKVFAKTGTVCRVIPADRKMVAEIPKGASIIIKRKGRLSMKVRGGALAHSRVYILGYEMPDGQVCVGARDDLGHDFPPRVTARWIKSMSKTNDKGMLPEAER